MSAQARFVAWVEYAKTHWHAECIVTGHPSLPDGSQVNLDTLRRFKIPVPEIPSFKEWCTERFERKMKNRKILNDISRKP